MMGAEESEDNIAQCFPWLPTNERVFQWDWCSSDASGKRLEQSQGRRVSLQCRGSSWWLGSVLWCTRVC